jgi:hypothetical protein
MILFENLVELFTRRNIKKKASQLPVCCLSIRRIDAFLTMCQLTGNMIVIGTHIFTQYCNAESNSKI